MFDDVFLRLDAQLACSGKGAREATSPFDADFLADVDELTRDAPGFEAKIRARYRAWQRTRGAAGPHAFPMPELAATVAFLRHHVGRMLVAFDGEHGLYHHGLTRLWRDVYGRAGLTRLAARQRRRLTAERAFFERIAADIDRLDEHGIPYDGLLRVVEGFGVAMAVANKAIMPPRMIPYQRFMQSNVDDAERELARYEARSGLIRNKPVDRFIVDPELIFGEDLPVVVLPTIGYLEPKHLVRTRASNLILTTVTHRLTFVDGYLMTPLTFLRHDVSFHGSMRYRRDEAYFAARGWDGRARDRFRHQQRAWADQLIEGIDAFPTDLERRALYCMIMETVHNRGRVLAPSSFLGRRQQLHYLYRNDIKNLSLLLYRQPTECGTTVRDVLRSSRMAQRWINRFWDEQARQPA